MANFTLVILCFLLGQAVHTQQSSPTTCKKITPFDVVCTQQNGHTTILSSHLCDTPGSPYFSLWMIDQARKIVVKDFRVKLGTDVKENKYGWSLKVSESFGQQAKVSVNLLFTNDTTQNYFEFVLRKFDCYKQVQNKGKTTPAAGQKLGEYSRLYIPPSMEKDIPKQIYLLFFDPCSIPFSYSVFTTADGQQNTMWRFTDTKNDTFIPTALDKTQTTQTGLHLLVKSEDRLGAYQATLVHVTKDGEGGKTIQLIQDTFETQLGLICPAHECSNSSKYGGKKCMLDWIDYGDVPRIVETDVLYLPCSKPLLVKMELMVKHDERLPFLAILHLTADKLDTLGTGDHKKIMHLGYIPYERKILPGEGYLPIGEGWISLYVEEHAGMSHVVIYRHFPTDKNLIPLANLYYNGTIDSMCPKQEGSLAPILVGVFSALAALIIVVVAIVFMRRRMRYLRMQGHQNDTVGLPHRIHLNDDEFNDNLDEY